MPSNTNPIFTLTPVMEWGVLTTANTSKTGAGATTIATAGANGSRVDKIRFSHLGSNIETVARIFVNNGQANGVPENNSLIAEITIPAHTISESAAQNITILSFPGGLHLPANYKLNATIGTAVAGGIQATVEFGHF